MSRADALIGTPGEIDWYSHPLVGQVDYAISVLGASNGNTALLGLIAPLYTSKALF